MSEEKNLKAVELNDDDLLSVSGGKVGDGPTTMVARKRRFCEECGKETDFRLISGGRGVCTECGAQVML